MIEDHRVSVSRACKLVDLPRSQFYYTTRKDDTELIDALQKLAFKHPTYGFRKLFSYLRRDGRNWNHKKVYRVYKLLKFNKKRKGKRRLPVRVRQPLTQQTQINHSWSVDGLAQLLHE